MKLGKRSRWMIIFAVLLTFLAIFLTHVDDVQATLDDLHVFTVLARADTEILQKTPMGQYYRTLLFKHSDELVQIMDAHHEHDEVLLHVIRLFIPELEALLDGKGDTVYVTSKHVESAKTELDWFASQGSLALQEDIRKEQQRLPLDNFIGMTMSNALDLINSKWTPDLEVEQTPVPDITIQQTVPALQAQQTLVPGTNGQWASYVHNGVYLEYPANYYYQIFAEPDWIIFVPFAGMSKHPNQWEIQVRVWDVPLAEKDKANVYFSYHVDSAENIVSKQLIETPEFEGIEYTLSFPSVPITYFRAFQYDDEHQLAVDILVVVSESPNAPDYSTIINQRYKYFQHIVNSVHMQTP